MIVWTHHRWRFPLPAGHKFPIDKYALLRDRVIADGTAGPGEVHEAEPVPWGWLEAVHDGGLLERIRAGALSVREERGLGLPWSEALVERGRRSTHGTVLAARHAAAHGLGMNLGGGTHHAGRDFARGYCLFNDVGVALRRLREEGLAERALVLDCDVHQGDGTAQMLGPDPGAFTVSLHGARNYPFQRIPSDLDVDIATGTGDERYLRALGEALDFALPRHGPTSPSTSRAPTVGGRPARTAVAQQGGPAGPRRAGAGPAARRGPARVRRAGGRVRARRRRHRRHQRRDGGRCRRAARHYPSEPGGVVVMGARRFCIPEVGVRFPPPPWSRTAGSRAARRQPRGPRRASRAGRNEGVPGQENRPRRIRRFPRPGVTGSGLNPPGPSHCVRIGGRRGRLEPGGRMIGQKSRWTVPSTTTTASPPTRTRSSSTEARSRLGAAHLDALVDLDGLDAGALRDVRAQRAGRGAGRGVLAHLGGAEVRAGADAAAVDRHEVVDDRVVGLQQGADRVVIGARAAEGGGVADGHDHLRRAGRDDLHGQLAGSASSGARPTIASTSAASSSGPNEGGSWSIEARAAVP